MLGKPVHIYQARLLSNGAGLAVVASSAGALWWFSHRLPGAPPAIVGVAILFTALAILLVVSFMRDASLRIVTHERGVAWKRGGEQHSLHFDDIKSIHELSSSLLIYRRSGKPLTLPTNVHDRARLLAHLNVNAPDLPKATIHSR